MWVVLGDQEEKQLFRHILEYYKHMVPTVEASLEEMPETLNSEQQALVDLTSNVPANAATLLKEAALKYNVMVIAYQRPEVVFELQSMDDCNTLSWSQVKDRFGLIMFRTFLAGCFQSVTAQWEQEDLENEEAELEGPFPEDSKDI